MPGAPRRPRYRKLDWNLDHPDFAAPAKAKFVYTVPNYSNPTGALVPQNARDGLLSPRYRGEDLAGRGRSLSAAAADRRAGPAFWPRCGRGRAAPITARSSIRYAFEERGPGLRVGWIVAEPKLIQLLALAKQCSDLSSSMFSQAVALEFLDSGAEAEIIPRLSPATASGAMRSAPAPRRCWATGSNGKSRPAACSCGRGEAAGLRYQPALQLRAAGERAFVPSSVFDPDGALTNAMRVNFTRNTPDRWKRAFADCAGRSTRSVRRIRCRDVGPMPTRLARPAATRVPKDVIDAQNAAPRQSRHSACLPSQPDPFRMDSR